jgi:bifunctional non-homologous end joining protein LigD
MRKESRGSRVYLDAQRMALGATVVPPYVVRPTASGNVSMPLTWAELEDVAGPEVFTVRTSLERLERVGDLWSSLLPPGFSRAGPRE